MSASFTIQLRDTRGRLYIPKDVMDLLKLHKGSYVKIEVEKLKQDTEK